MLWWAVVLSRLRVLEPGGLRACSGEAVDRAGVCRVMYGGGRRISWRFPGAVGALGMSILYRTVVAAPCPLWLRLSIESILVNSSYF